LSIYPVVSFILDIMFIVGLKNQADKVAEQNDPNNNSGGNASGGTASGGANPCT
jgi:hypothetical protein